MNLTAALTRACEKLKQDRTFNGLTVFNAWHMTEEEKRTAAADDGMSEEETERWINDYACVNFELDRWPMELHESAPYTEIVFDDAALQKDFRAFLLTFLDGDESVLPDEINLTGGDTEIMKPGYR